MINDKWAFTLLLLSTHDLSVAIGFEIKANLERWITNVKNILQTVFTSHLWAAAVLNLDENVIWT